jgi:hypothetical protein
MDPGGASAIGASATGATAVAARARGENEVEVGKRVRAERAVSGDPSAREARAASDREKWSEKWSERSRKCPASRRWERRSASSARLANMCSA